MKLIRKSSVVFVIIFMMVFTFTAANVNVSAAQAITFSGSGTLIINNDGSFDARGADISRGVIDLDTSIIADGNLEIISNNMNQIEFSSIDAKAGLTINGNGELIINNTAGTGITVVGDLEINSKLTVTGSLSGIIAPTNGNITINNTVVKILGHGNNGLRTIQGNITVNGGQLYSGGKVNSVYTDNGNISVIGSTALIEVTTRNSQSVRAEKGGITIDAGRIYVPDAKTDGISTGVGVTTFLTVKNGGVAEAYGDNSGVNGGNVLVDNAKIIGTSQRIGASSGHSMIVQNNATVTGTIINPEDGEQTFGVVAWAGDITVTSDAVITGTAEIGVLGFSGSVKADGGEIYGYGEQYGVEAGNVVAENDGIILGESTNQVLTARGVGARSNISADNGTIIGSSPYRGVFAVGTMNADNESLIKGNADKRIDGNAAVSAASITANNGSTIYETYAADVTHVTEEECNPYFNSKNMSDFKNFNWTATSGSVAKGTNGIYATSSSNNQTVLTAERMHEVGVSEVVALTSSGVNKHIIELPVVIEHISVPVDPGKPIINPIKPIITAPSVKEGVVVGTRFGPSTGDQSNSSIYLCLIMVSLVAFALTGVKWRKPNSND